MDANGDDYRDFPGNGTQVDPFGLVNEYVEVRGPRPSFLLGAASLWDFAAVLTETVSLPEELSSESALDVLAEDWEAVGRDLWTVWLGDDARSDAGRA